MHNDFLLQEVFFLLPLVEFSHVVLLEQSRVSFFAFSYHGAGKKSLEQLQASYVFSGCWWGKESVDQGRTAP